MGDGGAELRLDVVTDDRNAALLKAPGELRIAGDEDGNAVDQGDARLERALSVEACRLLGAHREVVEQNLRTGLAEREHDVLVGRLPLVGGQKRARFRVLPHVFRDAVENAAHPNRHARLTEIRAEDFRAVGGHEDRLGDILADLSRIDVERGDHLDVLGPIAADLPVHQPDGVFGRLPPVILEPLNQRAGAVSDPYNRDPDLVHRLQIASH